MTRTDFLGQLALIVEHPDLAPDTPLASTGLWDSMAWVQVMGLMDDCGMTDVTGLQISRCVTASEVLTLAGLG